MRPPAITVSWHNNDKICNVNRRCFWRQLVENETLFHCWTSATATLSHWVWWGQIIHPWWFGSSSSWIPGHHKIQCFVQKHQTKAARQIHMRDWIKLKVQYGNRCQTTLAFLPLWFPGNLAASYDNGSQFVSKQMPLAKSSRCDY